MTDSTASTATKRSSWYTVKVGKMSWTSTETFTCQSCHTEKLPVTANAVESGRCRPTGMCGYYECNFEGWCQDCFSYPEGERDDIARARAEE